MDKRKQKILFIGVSLVVFIVACISFFIKPKDEKKKKAKEDTKIEEVAEYKQDEEQNLEVNDNVDQPMYEEIEEQEVELDGVDDEVLISMGMTYDELYDYIRNSLIKYEYGYGYNAFAKRCIYQECKVEELDRNRIYYYFLLEGDEIPKDTYLTIFKSNEGEWEAHKGRYGYESYE